MTDFGLSLPAPRVRALLDGRMTQIRLRAWRERAVEREHRSPIYIYRIGDDGRYYMDFRTPWQRVQPGDRLWVRESFSYDRLDVDRDGILPPWLWVDGNPEGGDWTRPRPSIHMPRWASRLTLTVTEVRRERLQDISEEDARAEGIRLMREGGGTYVGREGPGSWVTPWPTAKEAFRDLWESLHGAGAWDANPEVVALNFICERKNIDAKEAA